MRSRGTPNPSRSRKLTPRSASGRVDRLHRASTSGQDALVDIPETHYAKASDGTHLAYQTLGDGPVDLVYMQPWISHLEDIWEEPRYERFLRKFASFSRLILFDRRGCGMSDPVPADRPPDLETRMNDARAVMDDVGSERAVVYGASESGAMAALFAATHPDRTVALVIHRIGGSDRVGSGLPVGSDARGARAGGRVHRGGLGHQ
jgi:pimeloyl-ACP methyl ester carboxylesterase